MDRHSGPRSNVRFHVPITAIDKGGKAVTYKQTVLAAVALLMGATLSGPAFAVNDEPLTDHWAPSEWGPDDKADRPGS